MKCHSYLDLLSSNTTDTPTFFFFYESAALSLFLRPSTSSRQCEPDPLVMFNLKMIQTLIPILLLLAAGQLEVEGRKFVVANSCKGDVWAAYTAPQKYDVTVNGKSGMGMWHQKSGQEDILEVPETCKWGGNVLSDGVELKGRGADFVVAAGKFWAATGCDENGTGCKVGGCPSGKW